MLFVYAGNVFKNGFSSKYTFLDKKLKLSPKLGLEIENQS